MESHGLGTCCSFNFALGKVECFRAPKGAGPNVTALFTLD